MTTGPGSPPPDLYQVLGVDPAASGEDITRAWRQRARAEHPDARPRDAAAPARFRALAEAWQVLGDPGRRAAYDQGLDPGRLPGRVRIAVRHSPATPGPGGAGSTASQAGAFGPPLVAGPVRVEGGSRPVPRARAWDEEDFRLALLAELVLRYRGRGRPW